jgi:undecaprenyl-diphosphatase
MTKNREAHADPPRDAAATPEQGDAPRDAAATPSVEAEATAPLRRTLQKVLATVDSQEKADAIIDALVQMTEQQQPVEEVANGGPTQNAAAAAAKVAAVDEETEGETPPQKILTESARAVVTTAGQDQAAISETIQAVFNPEQQVEAVPVQIQERQRSYLRRALIRRLGPVDALDADLFLRVNALPRNRWLNRFFYFLTRIYQGGAAWYGLMALMVLWRPQVGRRLVRETALPLGLAIALVEFPIKGYFRRRRPFITIVQTIVIGRKPDSWSFPSGHSATAFAGAWLLSRYLPRWRFPLYLVATLTAFSRIYLGAHYPGDVVAGSTLGVLFAWLLRRVPWPWRSGR